MLTVSIERRLGEPIVELRGHPVELGVYLIGGGLLTEGKQSQEIFIGVHRKFQTFSTQRLEFKTGREYQRPGLLLTIRVSNVNYSLLFLHIKSGDSTEAFGLRDAALAHAYKLKKALDKVSGGSANFMFLGDLNTMGIDDPVPYSKKMDLTAEEEEVRIASWGSRPVKWCKSASSC